MGKYLLVRYRLLIVFYLIATGLLASGVVDEKRKTINKTYDIGVGTALKVVNQFGDVHLNTWDKKELKVDVEVVVSGKNESRAQQLLDQVSIDISESGAQIAFETRYKSHMNTRNDESFEVNYTVYLPAGNEIFVQNKFGDTYIGPREGKAKLDISYGNLKTSDFSGPLQVELSFGKGFVGKTRNPEVEVKYSELEMAGGNALKMEQEFSDVVLGDFSEMKIESKYGNVVMGKVGSVDADVQFSGFTIERLEQRLVMEANYVSNFKIGMLSKDFSRVEFVGKFSAISIRLEDGLKADFEGEFGFSSLDSDLDDLKMYYQVKEDQRSEYKGRIGGGDPNRKIIVKSSYGDLRLR